MNVGQAASAETALFSTKYLHTVSSYILQILYQTPAQTFLNLSEPSGYFMCHQVKRCLMPYENFKFRNWRQYKAQYNGSKPKFLENH